MERRNKPRIEFPFPASIRGIDISAKAFEVNTTLNNISAAGLHVRLPCVVNEGASLSIVARLADASTDKRFGVRVSIQGVVVRVEPNLDGTSGVAVKFTRHNII
jgi:hypothetical protein